MIFFLRTGPQYGLGELALCINQQPWSYYCGKSRGLDKYGRNMNFEINADRQLRSY